MRSTALKLKQVQDEHRFTHQDNFPPGYEPSEEMRHARIAREAHEAANLPGNQGDCDFEEFATRFRLGYSDFA